jgi:hypothetical protein
MDKLKQIKSTIVVIVIPPFHVLYQHHTQNNKSNNRILIKDYLQLMLKQIYILSKL